MSTFRVWLSAFLYASLLGSNGALADPEAERVSETQIKAAFLYNFTRFVEWPAGTFQSKSHAIVIGILGEGPLAADLTAIVAGRRVNGREIVVTSVRGADEVAQAQMLFVSENADGQFDSLQMFIQESPVLTVGESPAFAAASGAIVFVRQNGKLRFEINMTAAERAHLKVSGELQKLAAAVRRTP